ncbi:MAG TPA: pantetheine-phosphate adenylyltransferase [Fibrobacteria bacterium]|nr:pantetheine-phosphate adenylyltransferase [Fibrobacteria bacterium]
MAIAVHPGSFDPPTKGHVDLVLRGRKLFERVVVVVGVNSRKQPLFSAAERVELFRAALEEAGVTDVEVLSWEGLTVEICRRVGATVVLRGLRQGGDFEAEQSIALMNRRLDPGIEAVYLNSREEYLGLTSTSVREISRMGGDVSAFVPTVVASALRRKMGGS